MVELATMRAEANVRDMFAERVDLHFSEGGALFVAPENADRHDEQRNDPATRFAELANDVERALFAESSRWGDQHRTGQSYTVDDWQNERDYLLSNYFPARSSIVLQQLVEIHLVARTLGHEQTDQQLGFSDVDLAVKGAKEFKSRFRQVTVLT